MLDSKGKKGIIESSESNARMKPVLGACERLDRHRASWLQGGSVGSGKKEKGCSLHVYVMDLLLNSKLENVTYENCCPIFVSLTPVQQLC